MLKAFGGFFVLLFILGGLVMASGGVGRERGLVHPLRAEGADLRRVSPARTWAGARKTQV